MDLLLLWRDAAEDQHERDEIIADLFEHIDVDDDPAELPKIPFEALPSILQNIRSQKTELTRHVDARGGVAAVAQEMDIPAPVLHRALFSGAMIPRAVLTRLQSTLITPRHART